VRLSELTEQLATTVNVREHAVVVADSPGEVVRVAFATIESHSIFERICVLEDLRDRLPKIVLAVPSRHAANVGTKIVHFKVLIVHIGRRDNWTAFRTKREHGQIGIDRHGPAQEPRAVGLNPSRLAIRHRR